MTTPLFTLRRSTFNVRRSTFSPFIPAHPTTTPPSPVHRPPFTLQRSTFNVRRSPFPLLALLSLTLSFLLLTSHAATISPLPNAHAHNDYEHPRPLLDALDRGFCSVEADIYLVDGQLLVAHNRPDVRPERDLETLYLKPLSQRAQTNQGRIHPNGPPFTLLIDFKTEADATYRVLQPLLRKYRDVLTEFTPDKTVPRAVTVILSGNRPIATLAAEPLRWAAIDGRLDDLDKPANAHLIPLVSQSWAVAFRWTGSGPFPDDQRAHLLQLVVKAHQQGRRLRFWGFPDREELWKTQLDAGVDLINTDRLDGLRAFLLRHPSAR